MAQKHNSYEEKPMTRYGTVQSPSRRYRRLRHPSFPAAEWTAKNPLLQRGEIGYETDTRQVKIGDGITYWNDLNYITASAITEWGSILGDIDDQTDLKNALDAKANTADLGSAAYTESSDYATSAQGALADTALQPGDNVSELVNDAGYLTQHQTLADLGITATAAEINVLDGITADTTELNYVDGVTSNIQTQLDRKVNKSGDTMTGELIMNYAHQVSFRNSDASSRFYFKADGQNTLVLGTSLNANIKLKWENTTGNLYSALSSATLGTSANKWDTLYVTKINNGGDITIPATSGTMALTSDIITYTGSDGITLTGTNFTNSGVRSVASGTANGTISVNTNGTSADVSVTGLGSAAYTASIDYATAAQGTLASTAVQPGDLATVATTGNYSDLSGTPSLATVATSGDYDDLLNKPTIPAAQVNSDWDAVSGVAEILNKPTTLGGYGITDGANTDLSNLTATGKATVANYAMPSSTYDALTLGASGTEYTAPGDGYFVLNKTHGANTNVEILTMENYAKPTTGTQWVDGLIVRQITNVNGISAGVFMPVKKGDKVMVLYTFSGNTNAFRFYYAQGEA